MRDGGRSDPIPTMTALNRRRFLATSGGAVFPAVLGAQDENDEKTHAEAALVEIEKRFLDRRFQVLLHYAGLEGEVVLPSAADCAASRPNGMA